MWFVYAYLWLPIISLGAWLAGLDFAYDKVLEAGGLEGLARIARWYGVGALIIILLVIGWSVSQRLRFKGKERRAARDTVPAETLRDEADLTSEDFETLRNHGRVIVSFDDTGTINKVVPVSRKDKGHR